MFRQVVAYRWADGVSEHDKSAFRDSFTSLRAIPELSSLRFADDARHFEGNYDVVAVMDFPDFAAARRYVADERHQAYVRDFASKMIGERVVVQHDWAVGDIAGVHHVTLPVSNVARSSDWYAMAFGFVALPGHHDVDNAVTLVQPIASIRMVLRHDPDRARALAGFEAITFSVSTIQDLEVLVDRLDANGFAHGERVTSRTGVKLDVIDPDGLVVQLTTLLS